MKKKIILCCFLALFFPALSVSAGELITVDKALKTVFTEATEFKKETLLLNTRQIEVVEAGSGVVLDEASSVVTIYTAKRDSTLLGFALEDTVKGRWGPIHYLMVVDPNGRVVEVVILDLKEKRGKGISKKRFLRQYQNKGAADPLSLKKDIDGISGATVSSRSLTDGVRKLLHIFQELNVPGGS